MKKKLFVYVKEDNSGYSFDYNITDNSYFDGVFVFGNKHFKKIVDDDFEKIIEDEDLRFYNHNICQRLKEVKGVEYGWKMITGCCQGDWNYCFFPLEKKEDISYFELCYFNLGLEYYVFEEKPTNEEIEDYGLPTICENYYYEDATKIEEMLCKDFNVKPEEIQWFDEKARVVYEWEER